MKQHLTFKIIWREPELLQADENVNGPEPCLHHIGHSAITPSDSAPRKPHNTVMNVTHSQTSTQRMSLSKPSLNTDHSAAQLATPAAMGVLLIPRALLTCSTQVCSHLLSGIALRQRRPHNIDLYPVLPATSFTHLRVRSPEPHVTHDHVWPVWHRLNRQ